jgi:hypothetical protein
MLIAATAAVCSFVATPALAGGAGPSGSYEDGSNAVTCNGYPNEPTRLDPEVRSDGVNVHGNTGSTYAGTGGVEACGDNGGSWRGRVIVSSSGSITYDGATWGGDPVAEDNGCGSVSLAGVADC